MHIVIDSREQTPWHFPEHLAQVSRGTLNAGDYALAGDQHFAIERKSVDDLAGTLSSGWARFERELERMQSQLFIARVVIVEGDIGRIVHSEHNHSQVTARFLFRRIAQLTLGNVTVLFAANPITAAGVAYSIFRVREETLNGEVRDNQRDGSASQAGSGLDFSEIGLALDDPEN